MKTATIRQLNQLNRQFYQTIASDFSRSRQQPWAGWVQVKELIAEKLGAQQSVRVLDVGCGNGRFGVFLAEQFPQQNFTYVGIDSDEQLLQEAALALSANWPPTSYSLQQIDIVDHLLEKGNFLADSETFDLVVSFGVLHHLPSTALRQKFIDSTASWVRSGGLWVMTAWQFDEDTTLVRRAFPAEKFAIHAAELEKNDYLLPWKEHQAIARYCHLVTPTEMSALLVATNLRTLATFRADGREGTQNLYLVATK